MSYGFPRSTGSMIPAIWSSMAAIRIRISLDSGRSIRVHFAIWSRGRWEFIDIYYTKSGECKRFYLFGNLGVNWRAKPSNFHHCQLRVIILALLLVSLNNSRTLEGSSISQLSLTKVFLALSNAIRDLDVHVSSSHHLIKVPT